LERKLASDEDEFAVEDVWKVLMSLSCSSVALVDNDDSWPGDIVGVPDGKAPRAGSAACHCDVGWKTKRDFGLRETWVGNFTFDSEASAIGADVFCDPCFPFLTLGRSERSSGRAFSLPLLDPKEGIGGLSFKLRSFRN